MKKTIMKCISFAVVICIILSMLAVPIFAQYESDTAEYESISWVYRESECAGVTNISFDSEL